MTTTDETTAFNTNDYDYEFIAPPDTESVDTEVSREVDISEFVDQAEETARARRYRKAVSNALGYLWRPLLSSPATLPDGAAILAYGPDIAREAGKLADQDARARKIIDFVTEGTDNGYVALFAATLPLAIQLLRNHEDAIKPEVRGIRIPRTKIQIKMRFGIKLGKIRNLSYDPGYLANRVLSDDKLIAALAKQGLKIAWTTDNNSAEPSGNGHKRFRRNATP